jgi:hypothetical protein
MRMAVAAGVAGVGVESILGDAAELRAAGAIETAATTVEWLERRFGPSESVIERSSGTATPDPLGGG